MLIRDPREEDLPEILRMGREFYAQTNSAEQGLGYDEQDFLVSMGTYYDEGLFVVAEHEGELVGGVAGITVPWFMCHRDVMVHEVWLWTDPKAPAGTGDALRKALESWAAGIGARTTQLFTPGNHEEGLARLYSRWGYKPAERSFYKRVCDG